MAIYTEPRPSVQSMMEHLGVRMTRARADTASGCAEHPQQTLEREACSQDFRHFLNHWWFVNRETGQWQTFRDLWPGQENIVAIMREQKWCFFLKAGKLGFTELECAYDAWVAIFHSPNARVHLLSLDLDAAKELLQIVKRGIQKLPSWLGLAIIENEAGADTTRQLRLRGGPDDKRTIRSYAAVKDAAIDQTAMHTHVDELARMPFPAQTWSAVNSTVPEGGSVHIVTRGQGDQNFTAQLWKSARSGGSPLYAHFEPFTSRPRVPVKPVPPGADPAEVWYAEKQESGMPSEELDWLAPRTWEDALRGSGEGAFLPEAVWLGCYDPDLPPLDPGSREPIVLALDAGVTNDFFAAVAVTRHPNRWEDPAVRAVQVWRPPEKGEIDFDAVERWIRILCQGGCVYGHPNGASRLSAVEGCEACRDGIRIPKHNVVQITYDSYQLVNMAQNLSRDRIAWCEKFNQGGERLEADANLRMLCISRRLAHRNDPVLNEHVRNADMKLSPGEDNKLRLIKREPAAKIDAAVALSMGVARALYLSLPKPRVA